MQKPLWEIGGLLLTSVNLLSMTFAEFKATADGVLPSYARRGQYAFNLLHQHRPDLSERVRGNHGNVRGDGTFGPDPFYRDENLLSFWEWVKAHWDD